MNLAKCEQCNGLYDGYGSSSATHCSTWCEQAAAGKGIILPTHEEYLKQKESKMQIEEITQYKVSGTIFETKREAVEFMAVEKLKAEINEILVLRFEDKRKVAASMDQIMEAVHTCLEGLTGDEDED